MVVLRQVLVLWIEPPKFRLFVPTQLFRPVVGPRAAGIVVLPILAAGFLA